MKEEVRVLFLLLVAFAVSRSFVVVHDNYIESDVIAATYDLPVEKVDRMIADGILSPYETVDYFIFSDVKLTPQTHAYFICMLIQFAVLYYSIYRLGHNLKPEFFVVFICHVAFLIEYFFTYGDPWFWVFIVPIGMDFIYGVILAMLIIQTLKYKWDQ